MARSRKRSKSGAFLDTEALRHLVLCPALADALWNPQARTATANALADLYGVERARRICETVGAQIISTTLKSLEDLFRKVAQNQSSAPAEEILSHIQLLVRLKLGKNLITPSLSLVLLEASICATLAVLTTAKSNEIHILYRQNMDSIRHFFPNRNARISRLKSLGIKAIKSVTRARVDAKRKTTTPDAANFFAAYPVVDLRASIRQHRASLNEQLGELWILNVSRGEEQPVRQKRRKSPVPDFFSDDEERENDSDAEQQADTYNSDSALENTPLRRSKSRRRSEALSPTVFDNDAQASLDEDDSEQVSTEKLISDTSSKRNSLDKQKEAVRSSIRKNAETSPRVTTRRSAKIASSPRRSERVAKRLQLNDNDGSSNATNRDDDSSLTDSDEEVDRTSDGIKGLAKALDGMDSEDFSSTETRRPTQRSPRRMETRQRRRDAMNPLDQKRKGSPDSGKNDGSHTKPDKIDEEDQDTGMQYEELSGVQGEKVRKLRDVVTSMQYDDASDPLHSSVKEAGLAKRRNRDSISRMYSPGEDARRITPIPDSESTGVKRKKRLNLSLGNGDESPSPGPGPRRKIRRHGSGRKLLRSGRYSAEEDKWLLEGLSLFGWGAWEKIVKKYWTEDYLRTAMSLKDRARTMHLNPEDFPKKTSGSGRKRNSVAGTPNQGDNSLEVTERDEDEVEEFEVSGEHAE